MKTFLTTLFAALLACPLFALEVKELLIVGDGMTKNAPMPEIGWNGNWGFAASSEDKDYAHLLLAKIKASSSAAKLTLDNIMYEDTMTGWVHLVPNSADVVIIQLGDNYKGGVSPEEYQNAYQQMIEELRGDSAKTVICIGPWQNAKIEPFIARAAQKAKARFVSLRALANDPANHAPVDPKFPKLAEAPNDRGMAAIADAVWQVLNQK